MYKHACKSRLNTSIALKHLDPGTPFHDLLQVKMALDRLTKFSVPVSMRRTITPAGVKPLPNLAQRTTKPQYDRATHAIFAAAVRGMVQSQKGINLER